MVNSVHSATGYPAGLPPSGQPDASPNSADAAQFQQAMNAPDNPADVPPEEKKDSLLEEMQGNIFSQVCRSMMENQRKLKENLDELRN